MNELMSLRKQVDSVSRPMGYNVHAWKVLKKTVMERLKNRESLSSFQRSQQGNWPELSRFVHLFQNIS